MSDLRGKTAIVTGGARGLGLAHALRLTARGVRVAVLDRDLAAGAAFADFGEQVLSDHDGIVGIQADLGVRAEVDRAVAEAIRQLGGGDILVNNAGGAITPDEVSHASQLRDEDIRVILDANLMSTIYTCQAVLPSMKREGQGAIVNTSSMSGRMVIGDGVHSHYGFAKAAVTHYTRTLAAEVGPFGIRVNCVAPGITMTGRMKAVAEKRGVGVASDIERIPLRRLGEPDDISRVVEFLVSDLAAYVTGQCISVCGGLAMQPA